MCSVTSFNRYICLNFGRKLLLHNKKILGPYAGEMLFADTHSD
jgi:hypothetical protein